MFFDINIGESIYLYTQRSEKTGLYNLSFSAHQINIGSHIFVAYFYVPTLSERAAGCTDLVRGFFQKRFVFIELLENIWSISTISVTERTTITRAARAAQISPHLFDFMMEWKILYYFITLSGGMK